MNDKPILLIGIDPNMNREAMNEVLTQLREQFPSYLVAVVAGMRYATVLSATASAEASVE